MDLGGICAEEVEFVQSGVALVRTAKTDNDEAGEGDDGAYHG